MEVEKIVAGKKTLLIGKNSRQWTQGQEVKFHEIEIQLFQSFSN
jgi:hypothetical protein